HISFYSSKNLKEWQHMSDFGANVGAHGGVWECPDLFKMPVEGGNEETPTGSSSPSSANKGLGVPDDQLKSNTSSEEKWVLLVSINPGGPNGGSATQYFVGNFDGSKFVADKMFLDAAGNKGIWIDWGRDNYAGVTWSNIPEDDGRRLFMGWMSNWQYANVVPTEKWRSAMTVARSLQLANTPAGLRLLSKPVEELEKLYENTRQLEAQMVSDSLSISNALGFNSPTFALQLALTADEALKGFALELSNSRGQRVIVGYDARRQAYYTDRRQAGNHNFSAEYPSIHYGPRLELGQEYSLHLLVDVASVELFADGGKTVMTDIFFPDEPFTNIKLRSEGGQLNLKSGQLNSIKSIWSGALQ
ncbi:MAG: GH32 C-terminal domain-containing protein, partial [Bacteroidetes bacterium]|nr:GH32 C-terminal domain-containing protein [Bacteroidota bacterium]